MAVVPAAREFSHRVEVRYLEVDRQGVVFHMWHLAYFDDALTAWMADRGAPYPRLIDAGLDLQLVHTELDWHGAVGFGDEVTVTVSLAAAGSSSLTVDFQTRLAGAAVVTGRTVYVVVALDGTGKRPVPPWLRTALDG